MELTIEEQRLRRKQQDHERYMRHHEERLKRNREYYAQNREKCILAVRISEYKRYLREKSENLNNN